jgi:hypothetical protein
MPGLTLRTLRRLEKMLRDYEAGRLTNPPRRPETRRARTASPRVAMLLEDCDSGDRAEAAVLVEIASTETQIVEIVGVPSAGTFKLRFSGEDTAELAYNISAKDMQTALESLSNIGRGQVRVEIGPDASLGARKIYRWLVHFTGRFVNANVPTLVPINVDMIVDNFDTKETGVQPVKVRNLPDVEDSGESLPVLCVVPLPRGVTLFAGSIGIAVWAPTFGYVWTALECLCDDGLLPDQLASY